MGENCDPVLGVIDGEDGLYLWIGVRTLELMSDYKSVVLTSVMQDCIGEKWASNWGWSVSSGEKRNKKETSASIGAKSENSGEKWDCTSATMESKKEKSDCNSETSVNMTAKSDCMTGCWGCNLEMLENKKATSENMRAKLDCMTETRDCKKEK